MKRAFALVFLTLLSAVTVSRAAVVTEPVEYRQGDTTLKGFIAYDSAVEGKRPGILVVHEWWGLNDYAKRRARMLAEAGYVAFALDMYGEGKTTEHPKEAGEWAAAVGQNQELAKARFMAAYDLLKKNPRTDPEHIAAIGYCFGGGVVLGAAMNGADLDAVVSFHGSLPQEPAPGQVKASVLVCYGGADQFVTRDQLHTFMTNLDAAHADWEVNIYGGAKHSFTNPDADKHGIPQLGYNKKADERSWREMLGFLEEAFH